jgi:hypothetical protein
LKEVNGLEKTPLSMKWNSDEGKCFLNCMQSARKIHAGFKVEER